MIERQSVAGRIFNWIKLYITKGQTSLRVRFTLWLQVFTFLTMLVIAVSVVLYINHTGVKVKMRLPIMLLKKWSEACKVRNR